MTIYEYVAVREANRLTQESSTQELATVRVMACSQRNCEIRRGG